VGDHSLLRCLGSFRRKGGKLRIFKVCASRYPSPGKARDIVTFGDNDKDIVLGSLLAVVLLELFPQSVRLDSNDGIDLWVVLSRSPKNLGADGVLFDLVGQAFDGFGADELQELLQAGSKPKNLGAQYSLKLRSLLFT
jgi:hypothetical protein